MLYQPLVSQDDVTQEAAVVLYEKKVQASQSIIRMKLQRQATEQLNIGDLIAGSDDFDENDPFESLSLALFQFTDAQDNVHQTLIAWALDQSEAVQILVNDFLDDPTDENLTICLEGLVEAGVELKSFGSTSKKKKASQTSQSGVSYSSILMKRLPATKDDLIRELSVYPIRRPAATVRQFLRRHANQFTVINDIIHLNNRL